jgi:hypothetical protein
MQINTLRAIANNKDLKIELTQELLDSIIKYNGLLDKEKKFYGMPSMIIMISLLLIGNLIFFAPWHLALIISIPILPLMNLLITIKNWIACVLNIL